MAATLAPAWRHPRPRDGRELPGCRTAASRTRGAARHRTLPSATASMRR